MADVVWIGNARKVAQVDTLTVGGTIEATDVFIVTINGKDLSVVGGSTDADTVASAIVSAFNASTEPEFTEITAAAGSGTGELTLTADTPGKPFTVTVSTTETGGGTADAQTFSRSATTANKGPNVADDGDNWSTGSVPTGSDDVYFENSSVSCLYELDNFSATAFASVNVFKSFTGDIGLPERNAGSGGNTYNEYRPTYFQLAATTLNIGEGAGDGSGRLKFDFGSAQMTANVFGTGTSKERGLPACLLKSTHASAAATVYDGSVGIAALASETSTIALTQRGGSVYLGPGVTVKTVDNVGGSLTAEGVSTTGSETLTLR